EHGVAGRRARLQPATAGAELHPPLAARHVGRGEPDGDRVVRPAARGRHVDLEELADPVGGELGRLQLAGPADRVLGVPAVHAGLLDLVAGDPAGGRRAPPRPHRPVGAGRPQRVEQRPGGPLRPVEQVAGGGRLRHRIPVGRRVGVAGGDDRGPAALHLAEVGEQVATGPVGAAGDPLVERAGEGGTERGAAAVDQLQHAVERDRHDAFLVLASDSFPRARVVRGEAVGVLGAQYPQPSEWWAVSGGPRGAAPPEWWAVSGGPPGAAPPEWWAVSGGPPGAAPPEWWAVSGGPPGAAPPEWW